MGHQAKPGKCDSCPLREICDASDSRRPSAHSKCDSCPDKEVCASIRSGGLTGMLLALLLHRSAQSTTIGIIRQDEGDTNKVNIVLHESYTRNGNEVHLGPKLLDTPVICDDDEGEMVHAIMNAFGLMIRDNPGQLERIMRKMTSSILMADARKASHITFVETGPS